MSIQIDAAKKRTRVRATVWASVVTTLILTLGGVIKVVLRTPTQHTMTVPRTENIPDTYPKQERVHSKNHAQMLSVSEPATKSVISGVAVRADDNTAIELANIEVVGRPEKYVTETNGQFQIEVSDPPANSLFRIRVTKPGFHTWDETVRARSSSVLVIPMERQLR